ANRKTVQQNVASVLAQVNVDRPEVSPLLVKAVSIHGDMVQPPLKGRQAPAYRVLEDWVQATLASNPQLAQRPTAAVPPVAPEPKGTEAAAAKTQEPPAAESAPAKAVTSAKAPEPSAAPVDAFDPAIFNRQTHPEPKTENKK